MKIYNISQGSEDWFNCRLGKITASIMHTLMGNSSTKDNLIYKISSEKITNKKCDSDIFSNKHIERGNELESIARSLYELDTNNNVEEVGFCELNEWVGCSPDGLVGEDGIIEIKCKDSHTFLKNKIKGIKGIEKQYITQMQFQMYVTERKWCDYVCYNENYDDILIIRIERDEEYIEKIKKEIELSTEKIKNIIENYKDVN